MGNAVISAFHPPIEIGGIPGGDLKERRFFMHCLHCILVKFEDVDSDEEVKKNAEEMADCARDIAMVETECYGCGDVFDCRTEDDAGRWKDKFPGKGVVLGSTEPERFAELLDGFRQRPLKEALKCLEWSRYARLAWRTREQVDADPALVIIDNPRNGEVSREGVPVYWSGEKTPVPLINEDFIQKTWSGEFDFMYIYSLIHALELADGRYTFDSGFYSLPDHSSKISEKTLEDAKSNPWRYALVFSDYHN